MVCYISCAFAVAFLAASLYIMLTSCNKNYPVDLTTDQEKIYQDIVKERLKIYLIASVVGAVLGLIYVFWMRTKIQTVPLICTAVLIFFLTQIVVYMIYPKSDYMLNHVTSNEQAKAWLDMYNQMMKKFWIGFFIGLIGYALLCLAFSK